LRKTKAKKELRRVDCEGMLNIQPLAIRSPLYSSSSSECAQGKVYYEKIQFVHMIIHDIGMIRTFVINFLHRSKKCWCVREQIKLGITLVDMVFIEELKEHEAMEQHFV
jgi:hypothetical protein